MKTFSQQKATRFLSGLGPISVTHLQVDTNPLHMEELEVTKPSSVIKEFLKAHLMGFNRIF